MAIATLNEGDIVLKANRFFGFDFPPELLTIVNAFWAQQINFPFLVVE